ncbi:MAG TPA: hypothetical protein VJ813_20520 [Vicinamibacterales bacterium]|nr:hypothetical protein [Vicinamibacterales bacterium]
MIAVLWSITLAVAALHTWRYRFNLWNLDAVSYLDVADAWRAGQWRDALNGYWSPAYSWALAAAFAVVTPAPEHEYVVLHAVNLGLFIVATAAFHRLVREMIRDMPPESVASAFQPAGCAVLMFLLFLWFGLTQFVVWAESPDLIPTAATFAAAALLLRLRRAATPASAALLGAVLGVGYLGKAAMLPVAPVFILAGAIASRRAWLRTGVTALLALGVVAGPWILALSVSRGRPTFGDSGRINYLWQVNRSENWPRHWPPHWPHWDGVEGRGQPAHPARRLHQSPAVYEFATPFTVTYPMWYSVDYWYEGVSPRFDLRDQLRRLKLSASDYLELLTLNRNNRDYFNPQPALFAVMLLLWFAAPLPRQRWRPAWALIAPAAAILVMYAFVRVAPRYVGAAVLLMWVAAFAAVRLAPGIEGRRLLRGASAAATVVLALAIAVVTLGEVSDGWRRLLRGEAAERNMPWYTASVLREAGVSPGTPAGVIGNAQVASRWARLARVRIVAEVPVADLPAFLEADDTTVAGVIAAFRQTAARVLIAERLPAGSKWSNWTAVEGTPYSLLWLDQPAGVTVR